MNPQVSFMAGVAFWVFAAVVLFGPIRWSVLAFILLAQFDLSAGTEYRLTTWGLENAIKSIVLTTLLLYRLRPFPRLERPFSVLARLWLLLTVYAALAVAWSPDKLSGLKMVGYLYAYAAIFFVFLACFRKGLLDAKLLATCMWASLILATVQSYLLGNSYGDAYFDGRFTSFTGAQSFAVFLLSLAILLFFRESLTWWKVLTITAGIVGVVLTGSRSTFLGALYALFIGSVFFALRSGKALRLTLVAKRGMITLTVLLAVSAIVFIALPENRLNEMVTAVLTKGTTVEDVGTFGWRYSLYEKILEEFPDRGPARLMFGAGTSSGGSLVVNLGFYNDQSADPNRAIHNEFLRALYEWGLVGLGLLASFLCLAVRYAMQNSTSTGSRATWALLAISGPLLVGLTVENVLAEAAGPAGVGLALIFASAADSCCASAQKKATKRTRSQQGQLNFASGFTLR
jgi:O-antigen ligase